MDETLSSKVAACLKQDWSPEQISGWLKKEDGLSIHHETIYRFILADKKQKGMLYKYLIGIKGKSIVNAMAPPITAQAYSIVLILSISVEKINNREVFGHWEADTIIGKGHQGAIITLDERISKLRMAYPVNSHR